MAFIQFESFNNIELQKAMYHRLLIKIVTTLCGMLMFSEIIR